jgi:glycerophosphoryl diester phosphodiesterase
LIAHRAGNRLASLRAAEAAGADLIECDLWSYRDRFEVRHEKTLGHLPIRWDRWKLERLTTSGLYLDALLDTWQGPGALLFDLKGRDRRLPAALLDALRRRPVPVAVTGRRPAMLDVLAANGLPVFPSVGSLLDVRRLERLASRRRWAGVSAHSKLLNASTLTRLRAIAPLVITWPVNTPAAAARLTALGVDGLISDDLSLVRALAAARSQS